MILALDVDGTLVESKQVVPAEITTELERLAENYTLAFFSGATLKTLQWQLLDNLYVRNDTYIFPNSAGTCWIYNGTRWNRMYEMHMASQTAWKISRAVDQVMRELNLFSLAEYGPYLEFRTSQITYSILGMKAPLSAKQAFDPTDEIKQSVADSLRKVLRDEYDVRYSRTTSVDISLPSINKGYGVNWLMNHVDGNVVYFGDRLGDRDGNDYPVTQTQAKTISVNDPEDTLTRLKML